MDQFESFNLTVHRLNPQQTQVQFSGRAPGADLPTLWAKTRLEILGRGELAGWTVAARSEDVQIALQRETVTASLRLEVAKKATA